MKLAEMIKNVAIEDTNFDLDLHLDDDYETVTHHTDDIIDKSIFVAIKGYVTDGHKFIEKAKNKGAKLAVVEEFQDIDIPQIKVLNTRIALADISNNYYDKPSKKLNMIGITATNGKTTTAFMVQKVLEEDNRTTGIIGTVFTKYSDIMVPSILTTPESVVLQKYLNEMYDKGITDVVMEVSSSAQELYRNKNIDFDFVTFNNLGREHIDQHGSFENYFRYKSRLIRNAKEDAIAVLNFDNEMIADLSNKTQAHVLSYSLKNLNRDFGISDLDLTTGKGNFIFHINHDIKIKDIIIKKNSFNIELGTVGYSSVMNSIVAIIIGLCLEIPVGTIQRALKNFAGVERRFELIYDEKFKILDDHFANEKNIDATMKTLKEMKYNNLNILYAIRGNRGVEVNKEITEKLVYWIDKLKPEKFCATLSKDVVTWKDEVSEAELNIFKKILKENGIECKIFDTLEEAVNDSINFLKKDDILLLAGCQGMDKGAKYVKDRLLNDNLVTDVCEFSKRIDGRIC